jgi:hypothetical protein
VLAAVDFNGSGLQKGEEMSRAVMAAVSDVALSYLCLLAALSAMVALVVVKLVADGASKSAESGPFWT